MKKISVITLSLAAILVTIGCDRNKNVELPSACFVANKTEVFTGEAIDFENCSQNAHHYQWDFGDSTYSTAENVTKAFAVAGRYVVKLTAYDENEKYVSVTTQLITVKEGTENPPHACFTAPDTVEINQPVLFLNCSEYALTYEWDFGDGGTSTALNPLHAYATEGVYQVKLTAHGVKETKDDTTQTIVVERPVHYYLTKLKLTKYPPNKGSILNPWDPIQGGLGNVMPDIYIAFKSQSGFPSGTTPVRNNQLSAPVEWNISGVELTDEPWVFEVYDDDSQDGGGEEQMGAVVGNVIRLGGDNGKATLTNSDGSIELEVHYVVQ